MCVPLYIVELVSVRDKCSAQHLHDFIHCTDWATPTNCDQLSGLSVSSLMFVHALCALITEIKYPLPIKEAIVQYGAPAVQTARQQGLGLQENLAFIVLFT